MQAATTAWVSSDLPPDTLAQQDRAQESLPDHPAHKNTPALSNHASKRDLAVCPTMQCSLAELAV